MQFVKLAQRLTNEIKDKLSFWTITENRRRVDGDQRIAQIVR